MTVAHDNALETGRLKRRLAPTRAGHVRHRTQGHTPIAGGRTSATVLVQYTAIIGPVKGLS